MEGLISVIIPVYNHTEHLREVLDALNAQTYTNLEVIVVDDGSTFPIVGDSFASSMQFPFVCVRQENAGAPAARNFGFALSQGEYVLFMDADVIASSEMLWKLMEALEKDPGASSIFR